ncbi:MAG TPA: FecR family protein, partial [Candidatus Cybelea sp.]|nr:FecR family protein [Candidatus Cybelea sp.]
MNYRFAVAAAAVLAVGFGAMAPSLADDKQLQNVKGSVSYQAPNATAIPVGVKAIVGVADNTYAITGAESLGALIMPDSSQIMVGASSKVQVAYFNQTNVANAKFVIYDGKVRFEVRHPAGAQANYTFSTASGSVAVRGTQGDIQYDSNGALRVNVYELCDNRYPVQITSKTGQIFKLTAGQSLAARIVNGILQGQVEQLTQQMIDQFTGDFGVPTSWD